MHFVAAFAAFLATVLYGYRTGQLVTTMPWSERTARLGIGLVLVSLVVGFLDQALNHAGFEWRHWVVLGSLAACIGGYVGLLVTERN